MSKRMQSSSEKIDSLKLYDIAEALELALETGTAKFSESVDVAISLGIIPAKENVRGACQLPHGTGKAVSIAVFADDDQVEALKNAGAKTVGLDALVDELKASCDQYDIIIASPEAMRTHVSKLAKILGPKGLMPNPKVGTVTKDLEKSVKEAVAGKAYYRNDKGGIVHSTIGRVNFKKEHLAENLSTLLQALVKAKPSTAKGKYLKALSLSATMGPGIKVDLSTISL